MRTFESINIGETHTTTEIITNEMIIRFSEVTGDTNKIHLDDNYAKSTVFGNRIAHGFLYGSFISKLIGTIFPGEGAVYLEQNMKFLYPVYINDKLLITVTASEKIGKNKIKLSTVITNNNGKLVLDGSALVSLPKGDSNV